MDYVSRRHLGETEQLFLGPGAWELVVRKELRENRNKCVIITRGPGPCWLGGCGEEDVEIR